MNEAPNSNGCYKCGSPEGNQARLCPTCAQARKAERQAVMAPREPVEQTSLASEYSGMLHHPYVQAGGVAALTGLLFYFLLFSVYGPGWGMSRGDFIYKKCMHKLGSGLAGMNPKGDSDAEKAMANFGQIFAQGLATEVCQKMKDECGKDASNPICAALK